MIVVVRRVESNNYYTLYRGRIIELYRDGDVPFVYIVRFCWLNVDLGSKFIFLHVKSQ